MSRPSRTVSDAPGGARRLARKPRLSARLKRLMAKMTLAEKLGQLNMSSGDYAVTGAYIDVKYLDQIRAAGAGSLLNFWGPEATRKAQKMALEETRLGIPLLFCLDVVHGQRTVFPIPLGEACAFDPVLWEKTARASAQDAADQGVHLTFAPMVDVSRDPRWGRICEGPGEDAFVGAVMARAKTRGYQGEELTRPGTLAATAKHFCAYGAAEGGRDYAAVDVSDRQLEEHFLPPFKASVEEGVAAIMPAFNDLAGVPMTAHGALLNGLLREDWGFEGVLVSDYTAVMELTKHGVASSLMQASALSINAGVDIDMMSQAYVNHLPEALERGLVTMETIDASVARVLRLKEKLGLFDDPYRKGAALKPKDFARHRALAREAAARSIVMLQNKRDALPISRHAKRIAVIGPLADRREEMLGSWAGEGDVRTAVPFLDGLRAALPDVRIDFAEGVPLDADDVTGLPGALDMARGADLLLLCLGEAANMSGEAASRAKLGLPGRQRELAQAALQLGIPSVVTLSSGRPLALPWLMAQADAVLATWQLGHEAGHALADVLTGAREPTGRLAVSWPWAEGQIPVYFGQRPTGRPMDPDQHYTSKYRDVPNSPQFAFGHGLGYTRFEIEAPRLDAARLAPGGSVTVEVPVRNVGARKGEETVFLFIHDVVASVARPLLELKGFARIALKPGARGLVRFTLNADDFVFLDAAMTPCLEPGLVEILAGPSAERAGLKVATLELVASPRGARARARRSPASA